MFCYKIEGLIIIDHRILLKFLKHFDQNSGGQPFRWLWNYLLKIPVWKVRELDDHRILMKCFKNFNQNSGGQPLKWLLSSWRIRWPRNSCEILQGFDNFKKKMTKEFLWNSSRISSRILVASLSIQQFKWLSNSSKARWPQNFYKILLGFWSEFCSSNQKIRWPWNSCEILQWLDQNWLEY